MTVDLSLIVAAVTLPLLTDFFPFLTVTIDSGVRRRTYSSPKVPDSKWRESVPHACLPQMTPLPGRARGECPDAA